jgi:phage replication-related protein YjqB (UPF0714/DUF867 family)
MSAGRFAELLAEPGVTERVVLGSCFGFMAIHGGSLERGTAEIAAAAAGASGASLYAVEQPADLRWHLPSHLTDPASSPQLRAFLHHVEVVISVHGYGRSGWWTRILAGGGNRTVAEDLASTLRLSLPSYEVFADLETIPVELRGLHPGNPVNVVGGGGVQLELPPRIRGIGPRASERDTRALVSGLAAFAQ